MLCTSIVGVNGLKATYLRDVPTMPPNFLSHILHLDNWTHVRIYLMQHWYVLYPDEGPWYELLIIPLRFELLCSIMIPISIKVILLRIRSLFFDGMLVAYYNWSLLIYIAVFRRYVKNSYGHNFALIRWEISIETYLYWWIKRAKCMAFTDLFVIAFYFHVLYSIVLLVSTRL